MNSVTVFIFGFHDFKMELNDLLLEYNNPLYKTCKEGFVNLN